MSWYENLLQLRLIVLNIIEINSVKSGEIDINVLATFPTRSMS